MKKDEIRKVVLAYSGGLDTSIIIPWLKENYNNCEVIAVSGNVGQADELEGLEEKALKTGASKLYVLDLTDEYVNNYAVIIQRSSRFVNCFYEKIFIFSMFYEYLCNLEQVRPNLTVRGTSMGFRVENRH